VAANMKSRLRDGYALFPALHHGLERAGSCRERSSVNSWPALALASLVGQLSSFKAGAEHAFLRSLAWASTAVPSRLLDAARRSRSVRLRKTPQQYRS